MATEHRFFFSTCIVLAALPQSPGPDGGFRGYAFAYFDTVDNATIAKDALNGTGPGPFAGPETTLPPPLRGSLPRAINQQATPTK